MNRLFLLVDDDEEDASLFSEALRSADPAITMDHVPDGGKMFQYLESAASKPDLIFLDINLPGLSGWQCLIQLKSHYEYMNIPVIIYSSSYAPDDHEMAKSMRAEGLLTKPNTYSALVEALTIISKCEMKELGEMLKKF